MDQSSKPEGVWTVQNFGDNLQDVHQTLGVSQDTDLADPRDLGTIEINAPEGEVLQTRPVSDEEKRRVLICAVFISPLVLMSLPFLMNTTVGIDSEGEEDKEQLQLKIYDKAPVTDGKCISLLCKRTEKPIHEHKDNSPPPLAGVLGGKQKKEEEKREGDAVNRSLHRIVAGILIILIGYRYVAMAGAVMGAIGNLIAAASPLSIHTLSFSLGFLQGLGNIFLMTSVTVAIVLQVEAGVDLSLKWRSLHYFQFATYAVFGVAFSSRLTPLNLHMQDDPQETFVGRAMEIRSLSPALLKCPNVYALLGVFFFTGLGDNLAAVHLTAASDYTFLAGVLPAVLFLVFGSLVVTLALTCCRRCCCRCCNLADTALRNVVVLGFVMGSLCLTAHAFSLGYYAHVFALLFGVSAGSRVPLMKHVIPSAADTAVAKKNLGLLVGAAEFARGLGVIIGAEVSESITEDGTVTSAKGVFYYIGVTLIISSVCALVLHYKTKKESPEAEGSTTRTQQPTDAERPAESRPSADAGQVTRGSNQGREQAEQP
ncbi:hypothetical protein BaRGS_00016102 [Batillaria attramentaria]|uniref:Uncharacterized protein n=1 Tax=Batillaria attramentaria TaxID=370345 RepID=A0ABD0KZE9_9CAEN